MQRQHLITELVKFLKDQPSVNAVWEGGAAAWKRVDQWSDIDLMADADDERAAELMRLTERFLDEQFGIDLKFEVLQGWPGVVQTFFTLKNYSPFLMVDFCIVKNSAKDKFLEQQVHGVPHIHFDRKNILQPVFADDKQLAEKLRQRLPLLHSRFHIFQTLVEKELHRGNYMEAVGFYMGYTLNPLVEALRIAYAPYHWNFSFRYLQYDLPAGIVAQVEPLYFVADAEDLRQKWNSARRMFDAAIKEAEETLKDILNSVAQGGE